MTKTRIRLPLVLVAMLLGIGAVGVACGTPVEKTDSETATETKSTPQNPPSKSLDELRLSAYAPLEGGEAVFYMQGWAYGFVPGERPRKLFGIEGFNIRNYVPVEDMESDLILASRELVFYTDPKTGEPISEWLNPYNEQTVEVFHIQNDPVNFRMRRQGESYVGVSLDGSRVYGPSAPPAEWDDYFVWHADVFPFYPIPGWEKNYTAAEMFDFYVPKAGLSSEPFETMVSWTRVGPWLPWLGMDGHDGLMVYHARSRRLSSWDDLPEWIRARVDQEYPQYRNPPKEVDVTGHNETSWTFYMKEMKRRAQATGGS
jgi:hypothetical protein